MKVNYKIIGILSLLVISTFFPFFFLTFKEYNFYEESEVLPKASDDIDIITPLNTTYTEAMSGYYPATLSFESDDVGLPPLSTEWDDGSTGACTISIIAELSGHKKVLDLNDANEAGTNPSAEHHWAAGVPNLYGTVELWFRTTDATKMSQIIVRRGTINRIRLSVDNSKWRYSVGASTWDVPGISSTVAANIWYRVRLDYEASTGGYQGLGQYKWKVTIDGDVSNQLPFASNGDVSRLRLVTAGGDQNYHMYVDAVGLSFENYNIGDNEYEGLLIDYNTGLNLITQGYSLDGAGTVAIAGDKVIPLPPDGSHTVQVFGTISGGTPYESSIRYFHVYRGATIPSAPSSVDLNQGIFHVYLMWNAPTGHVAPITHYNIYRGNSTGGLKEIIGTTSNLFYNDTEAGLHIGQEFFYTITAVNILGESPDSAEVSGSARDQPFIEWKTPSENARIVFGVNANTFNFTYDCVELVDVQLEFNGDDFGSVWGITSKNITWSESINGPVTAVLYGYEEGNPTSIVSDSRQFTFVKILSQVKEVLDSNTTIVGQQLFMILHDPHGDNSYSSFTESTTLSIGVGSEITTSLSVDVEIGSDFELFGIGGGASALVSLETTSELGFDFRMEVTDTTSLSSNTITDDPDYIGPGYGDAYWGEAWIYKWVLKAYRRVYSNNSLLEVYEEPKLYYGILRDVETICNDMNAPEDWRAQNPVHNGFQNCTWDHPLAFAGGFPYSDQHEITSAFTRKSSFSINIGTEARVKLGIVETTWGIEIGMRNYAEVGLAHSYETEYYIYDDEGADWIVQGLGIDDVFGTYIFNSSSFFCETSQPLEHNTFDYVPPTIEFPDCKYDTNNDQQSPCNDDSPFVTVEIFDEGGIQQVHIKYSINGGIDWGFIILTEQVGNLGTWEGSIPAQDTGITVLWYIIAWDLEGWNATRLSISMAPFQYTVIEKKGVPGYSLILILSSMIIAVFAIVIVFHRKYRKS